MRGVVSAAAQVEALVGAWLAGPEAVARRAAAVRDWEPPLAAARATGVGRLLLHALLEARVPLPPPLAREATRALAGGELRARRLAEALDEVLGALARAGVRAAPYKGPFLAERLYPAHALRPSGDLDVLVAPTELPRAVAALEGIGYGLRARTDEARYRREHHDVQLDRPRSPLLELHHRPLSGFAAELAAAPLLARATPTVTRGGAPALRFAAEDELHLLALHAASHLFLRLTWLVDIALLAARHPGLDGATLAARARAAGTGAALACALEQVRRRLGAPVPALPGLDARGARQAIARRLLVATTRRPLGDPFRTAGRLTFLTLLCDSPARAARELARVSAGVARRRARRLLG